MRGKPQLSQSAVSRQISPSRSLSVPLFHRMPALILTSRANSSVSHARGGVRQLAMSESLIPNGRPPEGPLEITRSVASAGPSIGNQAFRHRQLGEHLAGGGGTGVRPARLGSSRGHGGGTGGPLRLSSRALIWRADADWLR